MSTVHEKTRPPAQDKNCLDNESALVEYPSGKLAVVTRKKNEILELMKNVPPVDKNTFHKEYAVYCNRVESLLSACEDEINKPHATAYDVEQVLLWKTKVNGEISEFREIVMEYVQQTFPAASSKPNLGDELVDLGSVCSRGSRASSVQSLRVRLAEQRAKREANELYLKQKDELNDKRMKLEKEFAALELQKERNIETNLEREIEALESVSSYRDCSPGSRQSSGKHHNDDSQSGAIRMLVQAQERSMLPKNEPMVFDGTDLTQFRTFMVAFETIIESKCDSDSDRLYYLEKYTSGNPRKLVRSCFGNDCKKSYQKALKLLRAKYGNEFRIGESYLQKLEQWPCIKSGDGKSFEELSIFLMSCENTMENSDILNQLNSPKEIMEIVRKLPYSCREKWRVHAHKLVNKGSPVNFAELVKFVDLQSSILNLPVFSDIADDERKSIQMRKKNFTLRSDNDHSEVEPSQSAHLLGACHCCKKTNHRLDDCIFFNKKSHKDKIELLRANNLCFSCLQYGHISSGCTNRHSCTKCSRKHPTSLHNDNFLQQRNQGQYSKVEDTSRELDEQPSTEENSTSLASKCVGEGGAGLHKIACAVIPVKLRIQGTSHSVETYMALDNFSTDCFLDQELLDELCIRGQHKTMMLTTMGSAGEKLSVQVVNNLEVTDLDGNASQIIPVSFATAKWPFSWEDSPRPEDIEKLPYLSGVPFSFINRKIGLLVGANIPSLIRPVSVVSRGDDEPYACEYKLGWALSGPVSGTEVRSSCHRVKMCGDDVNSKINELLSKDFEGCHDDEFGPSLKERWWSDKVENSFKIRDDGHFEICLPFEDSGESFPLNRCQALRRLNGLKTKFRKNNGFFREYDSFIKLMLESDFAEPVPVNESPSEGKVWYLVHHGVYHPQKLKLRVVFDCSLKFEGVSLNDRLLQGPDLTNNLLGVLLRFRQGQIAVLADVEKMYYQVKVPKTDKNFMRFLWFPDGNIEADPVDYRLTVHVFGAKSSPSCASYALRRTANAKGDFCREARESILRDFYVDDFVKSIDCPKTATTLIRDVKKLLSLGGFNLTGFVSNSCDALSLLDIENCKQDARGGTYERVLGVLWNVEKDLFEFSLRLPVEKLTKRGILSTIFAIYDPFGFASPITLAGKRIFQQACLANIGWDSELPRNILVSWKDWRKDIQSISELRIERPLIGPGTIRKAVELHVFCDGSEVGYGAVAYVRVVDTTDQVTVSLVMSKSRLLPAGKSGLTTIPRIELTSAHLAVKIKNILDREMEFTWNSVHMWTDSMTVLKYIFNETKRFQRFVSNKISFIREHTSPKHWHHVQSLENPADLASRGATVERLKNNSLWLHGPRFLKAPCEFSSEEGAGTLSDVEENDSEVKRCKTFVTCPRNVHEWDEECHSVMTKLLSSRSDWQKLIRRVAAILRVRKFLHHHQATVGEFSVEELNNSERRILELTQRLHFPRLSKLKKERLPKGHPLAKLCPGFDDEGILRVGGRLSRAETSFDVKHPIIIPKESFVALLLVRDAHQRLGHMGKSSVLSELRRKFWIIGGNTLVKQVVRNCVLCRKLKGRPSSQIMADLPRDRLESNQKVFSNVGLDCFGPLQVSRGRGKAIEKRYGVIFSCLNSRAVHIEISHSLDTDSFLSAFSRFIARRGPVKIIRSDNGTNFTSGQKELKDALNIWNSHSAPWMSQRNIKWKFQPPASSHFGGIWEREIRTIRQVFGGLTRNQQLKMTDERLNTLMCEIENILNNRPISEMSDDPNDLEPLTPNHLLLLNTGVTFPPGLFSAGDLYGKRRWRQVQYLADLFWSRWRKEYLPLLQERQKWVQEKSPHKIGDLVLVVDQLLPRSQWATGRITEVTKDEKGNVRSAKIAVAKIKRDKSNYNARIVLVERPIVKLILLRSE